VNNSQGHRSVRGQAWVCQFPPANKYFVA
jgi:hypothetical protein